MEEVDIVIRRRGYLSLHYLDILIFFLCLFARLFNAIDHTRTRILPLSLLSRERPSRDGDSRTLSFLLIDSLSPQTDKELDRIGTVLSGRRRLDAR